MTVKSVVIAQIQQVGRETKTDLPALTDDLVLLNSGLDSLAIAIAVTRLEDALGVDPFTESDDTSYPVTVGDFIRLYENAAKLPKADSGQAA